MSAINAYGAAAAQRFMTSGSIEPAPYLIPTKAEISLVQWNRPTSLGVTIAMYREMATCHEIGTHEYFALVFTEVYGHAYETWHMAPEFDSELPELDAIALAAGIPNWMEFRSRFADGGIQDIPELTPEQREVYERECDRWEEGFNSYVARLLGEVGERTFEQWFLIDPDSLWAIADHIRAGLKGDC